MRGMRAEISSAMELRRLDQLPTCNAGLRIPFCVEGFEVLKVALDRLEPLTHWG